VFASLGPDAPDPGVISDFVVIGGGIVGLTIALEARRRFDGADVVLIEKEPACGLHASGRNSGVLHAGFYYSADSLKARLTRDGNRAMSVYCRERKLPINGCGKLVVARNAAELAGLDELMRRGRVNGVALEQLSADEARKIEPRVKTHERALFSPTTSSVDPQTVVESLAAEFTHCGGRLMTNTAYLGRRPDGILTSQGPLGAGYVINAAGLYADRVARDYGFSRDYRILPFKGVYLYADQTSPSLHTNVYPVPDLGYPFLGTHFTVTVDGRAKIGPTAMPALWREQYGWMRGARLGELVDIVGREAGLFLRNDFGFRTLAWRELSKYSRRHLVALAGELVAGVTPEQYRHWGKPGIRAQLLNIRERKLEMDFRLEGDDKSFHVLNAVSPAFTCALSFARYAVDQVVAYRGKRETGSEKGETGSEKREAGSGKTEATGEKREAGSEKGDAGSGEPQLST
jgi:L-2-hydroxyglutarate oxidase